VAGKTLPVFGNNSVFVPRIPAGSAHWPFIRSWPELKMTLAGIVKMSRLQNVDIAPLPKPHPSGKL
jgi:hypothetical protein